MNFMVPTRRLFIFVGLFLGLSAICLAQGPNQATLVEADKDSLCYADCPIIPLPNIYGVYYYCFQVGSEVLIGEHQIWEIGLKRLADLKGQAVPVRYDKAKIWVTLPNGWKVYLSQSYWEHPFKNPTCRHASTMRSLEHGYTRPQPVPGSPAQPVMRGQLVFGWALCNSTLYDGTVNCQVWDLQGMVRQKGLYEKVGATAAGQDANQMARLVDAFDLIRLKDGSTFRRQVAPTLIQEPAETHP
jgi:hypothetical protein